ncbi:MAG: hypothetical protein QOE60_1854, partial [Thermoleophilaceae bacterium]|nr:hypothetical protein [Thermoleophilaceae bacterium]
MKRPLGLLVCLVAVGLAACGGGNDDRGGGNPPAPKQQAAAPGCRQVAQPQPKPDGGAKRPAQALDPGATYDVLLKTSCGDIT